METKFCLSFFFFFQVQEITKNLVFQAALKPEYISCSNLEPLSKQQADFHVVLMWTMVYSNKKYNSS